MAFAMWTAILVVIATGAIFLYKYLTKGFGYWKTQGVKSVRAIPFFGTELSMMTTPLHEVDMDRAEKFGKIYGLYFMGSPILSVADPEIIRYVLVKDFPSFVNRQSIKTGVKIFDDQLSSITNDDWKRIRSVVSPTFTSGKIRKMSTLVKDLAERVTKKFLDAAEKDEEIESKKFFSSFTMDVIGACSFGVSVDSMNNPDHPFVVNSEKLFKGGASVLTVFFIIMPSLLKYVKGYVLRKTGFQFFIDVATDMIHRRKKEPNEKRVDFLQLMLEAQEGKLESNKGEDESPDNNTHYTQIPTESKPWTTSKTISESEILAQCVIFLLAGHETTATSLNYVIYNLAMNPDVQDKLLKEIDEAWIKNIDIDYDAVNKMVYLDAVISETLRKHVIATRTLREANEDYTIPNTQIVIPKGGKVVIPVYAMHHDPQYFPNPEKFDPDRFLPENRDDITPYSYLPFGDGPRNCIGMRFALMNIKLCLVHILRRVKFTATEETKKPLEFIVGQGLLQAKKIIVKPEKRTA